MNEFLKIIEQFKSLKVLVIGEAILDVYLQGTANRFSREAPVPIIDVEKIEEMPGGGANTAVNVRKLGAETFFLSVIGCDQHANTLRAKFKKLGIKNYSLVDEKRQTLLKKRIIARSQMLLRYDLGTTTPIEEATEQKLIEIIIDLYPEIDVLIVSDYGYGILTKNIISTLSKLQNSLPRIVAVDSKYLEKYQSLTATIVKPNYEEVLKLLDLKALKEKGIKSQQILPYGEKILEATGATIAAVTLDTEGALIFEYGEKPYRTFAVAKENSKTSGAGDTFISAFALSLAVGAKTDTASEIASAAASIVVSADGTISVEKEELESLFLSRKQLEKEQLQEKLLLYRKTGKKIVFTNGCFDILHKGHVAYLRRAKKLGDILIVGINSDESVKRLKGINRPINPLEDRMEVLSSLESIDHIISFTEDNPVNLINIIRPDIFVKGGDYTRQTLPEANLVERLGGKVEILPLVADHSTTEIIKRIRSGIKRKYAMETM